MLARSISLSSTISRLLDPPFEEALDAGEGVVQRLLAHRLLQEGEGPELQPALPAVVDRDDVDGDVPGARVVLEAVEDDPAVHVGQAQVERDGVGLQLVRQLQGRLAVRGDHGLEAHLVRLVEQDRGEPGLVLDDQEDAVAGLDRVAVVAADLGLGVEAGPPRGPRGRGVGPARSRAPGGRRPRGAGGPGARPARSPAAGRG